MAGQGDKFALLGHPDDRYRFFHPDAHISDPHIQAARSFVDGKSAGDLAQFRAAFTRLQSFLSGTESATPDISAFAAGEIGNIDDPDLKSLWKRFWSECGSNMLSIESHIITIIIRRGLEQQWRQWRPRWA